MDEQPVPQPGEPEPEPPVPAEPPAQSGWIQPPPDQKPSRLLPRLLAVVAVGVFGIVALLIFIGSQVDPRDVAARDFGQRLMDMPEFKARYGEVDTADEAYQLGQQLAASAIVRLDDPSLLRYWELTEVVLQNADDRTCSQVMRQTIESEDANELVRTLDQDQFEELLGITFKAFEADLKGTSGPPSPSDADVQAASLALANAMGTDQVTQAATALQDPTAGDAAVCSAAKSFIHGVLQLQEPHRGTFLRFMASP